MTITIAIIINPVHIPALKIAAIASQLLKNGKENIIAKIPGFLLNIIF